MKMMTKKILAVSTFFGTTHWSGRETAIYSFPDNHIYRSYKVSDNVVDDESSNE